jgi:glycerophosphoryl diester phosphodiesterase
MVEIIAHRGARSLAPENTLAAARLAHTLGSHRWETDVSLTMDWHTVLFHDATLTRCTNAARVFSYDPENPLGRDRLNTYTLMDLELLEAGSYFERTDPYGTLAQVEQQDLARFRREPIPTLYDGLVLTRDMGWAINVELKDHHNDPQPCFTASRTLGEIARAGIAHENVTISSFNHAWLRWVRDQAPEIQIQALVGNDEDIPLDFDAPVFTNEEFCVLNLNAALTPPKMVRKLKARGKTVNLFTVNDPHDYIRFVNAGADGIITDFPQRFIK